MAPGRAQMTFASIVLSLAIVINFEQSALTFFYIDRQSLVMTLAAVVIAGLLVYRNLLFIVLVCGLVVAVNTPADFYHRLAPDNNILHDTLLIITFGPMFLRLLGFGTDTRPAASRPAACSQPGGRRMSDQVQAAPA